MSDTKDDPVTHISSGDHYLQVYDIDRCVLNTTNRWGEGTQELTFVHTNGLRFTTVYHPDYISNATKDFKEAQELVKSKEDDISSPVIKVSKELTPKGHPWIRELSQTSRVYQIDAFDSEQRARLSELTSQSIIDWWVKLSMTSTKVRCQLAAGWHAKSAILLFYVSVYVEGEYNRPLAPGMTCLVLKNVMTQAVNAKVVEYYDDGSGIKDAFDKSEGLLQAACDTTFHMHHFVNDGLPRRRRKNKRFSYL